MMLKMVSEDEKNRSVKESKEVRIHPTAIVAKGAQLDTGVEIGPYCIVSEEALIGKNSRLISHVVIDGKVSVGEQNVFYPFSVIGAAPQALKYNQEPTEVLIGHCNTIRECVTINRGMVDAQGYTQVGDHNLLMAYTHLAHDVTLKNQIVLANSCQIAGHVLIEDYAVVGGASQVVQFCRIGAHAYIAGATCVRKDVFPYVSGKNDGDGFKPAGINTVGLKRRGFSEASIRFLREIYKTYFLHNLGHQDALEKIKDLSKNLEKEADRSIPTVLEYVIQFLSHSQVGLAR